LFYLPRCLDFPQACYIYHAFPSSGKQTFTSESACITTGISLSLPLLSRATEQEKRAEDRRGYSTHLGGNKKEQRKNENNQITPNSQQAKYETSYIWADGMNDHREKRG